MGVREVVQAALREDLIDGRDVTTELFIDPSTRAVAWIEARESAMVSGLSVASEVFAEVDSTLNVETSVSDGTRVVSMQRVMTIEGAAGSILKAERTALNFLCHLSGIATLTFTFVEASRSVHMKILCTRKTTPGLRDLEIAAVRHGGGDVFRCHLSDAVLLKDNHLATLNGMAGARRRVDELRKRDPLLAARLLETGKIEASTMDELAEAVDMGWKQVLLDNFTPPQVRQAVSRFGERVFLEASGGVNLSNVAEYASAGVHAVSVGALTHSCPIADFALEFEGRHA